MMELPNQYLKVSLVVDLVYVILNNSFFKERTSNCSDPSLNDHQLTCSRQQAHEGKGFIGVKKSEKWKNVTELNGHFTLCRSRAIYHAKCAR